MEEQSQLNLFEVLKGCLTIDSTVVWKEGYK